MAVWCVYLALGRGLIKSGISLQVFKDDVWLLFLVQITAFGKAEYKNQFQALVNNTT